MTTLKDYPYWGAEKETDVKEQLRQICNIRKDDITQFGNLPEIFMSGRKVGKIPTGSTDIAVTDRLGDFNYDASYWYQVVDDTGNARWRRIALATW